MADDHPHNASPEFAFWVAQGPKKHEFRAQTRDGDVSEAYSPPLWKTKTNRVTNNNDKNPLLPQDHIISPRSRIQAIAKGRRELMEIIQNMPESSYELSLKDIVDHEIVPGEQSQHQKTKQKQNVRVCKLSRSGSLDSSTFLLKMFLPTSLTGKNATRTSTKVVSKSKSYQGLDRSSSKSNSNSNRCWPFFQTKKNKSWTKMSASSE